MLILTRRRNEKIQIGDKVLVTVLDVMGGRVRLGVEAPEDMIIRRIDQPEPPLPESKVA